MRDIRKDFKHITKALVVVATVLLTTFVTVGSTYAAVSTLGVPTAVASDQVLVRRPGFDPFFRPVIVDPFFAPRIFNPFFAPRIFNPFFGVEVEDDFGFGFEGFEGFEDD